MWCLAVVLVISACGQGPCTRVIPYDLSQYQVYIKQSIHYLSQQTIIHDKPTQVSVCLDTHKEGLVTGHILSG